LVFVDSLHWCTGADKNTENSAKYLGGFSDIFLFLVRKKSIQKV
jgi:hypothetical protein